MSRRPVLPTLDFAKSTGGPDEQVLIAQDSPSKGGCGRSTERRWMPCMSLARDGWLEALRINHPESLWKYHLKSYQTKVTIRLVTLVVPTTFSRRDGDI